MDVRQLLKDADLSAEEINTLTEQLGTTSSQMSSMGIDLAKPAYGFVSPSGYFGMLCKVSQEDDLRQFLATSRNGHTITAIQQQRGYSWAVIDGNYLVAFGDGKLLGMGPAVGAAQDQLRNEMYRYLEQDKKESGLASALYERLRGMDDALAAVLTMGILPEAVGKVMSGYIPASATKDAVLALTAQVEPHAAHLRTELFADNKEAKQYMEQFEEVFNTIDGSLLAQTQDNTALWLCANIEGDEVLKMLRKVPAIRTVLMALNFVFDADQMLKAIDGDNEDTAKNIIRNCLEILDVAVAATEDRLARRPEDNDARMLLGGLFLRRARMLQPFGHVEEASGDLMSAVRAYAPVAAGGGAHAASAKAQKELCDALIKEWNRR